MTTIPNGNRAHLNRSTVYSLLSCAMIDASPFIVPVTDQAISLARLGGDLKLWKVLVSFFLEDAPPLMRQLREAYCSNDFQLIAGRAHSLKGLSATFEAIPFQHLAVEIESRARSRDSIQLDSLIPQLELEFDRLIVHLRDESR